MKLKQLVSIILMQIIVVFCCMSVFADANLSNCLYELNCYIDSVLPGYLDAMVANGTNAKSVTISNPMEIYDINGDSSDKYAVFVLSDDEIIGQLTIDCVDGQFESSLTVADYLIKVNDAYKNNEALAFINCNNNFIMYNGVNADILIDDDCACDLCKQTEKMDYRISACNEKYDFVTLKKIIPESFVGKVNCPSGFTSNRTLTNYMLSIPIVKNSTNPVDGKGLCWAASIASVVNYKKSTSHTAYGLFMICWNSVQNSNSNIPVGTVSWIKKAYALCNVSVSFTNDNITGNIMASHIYLNRPVQLGLFQNSTGIGHSVVVTGITNLSTSGYYYFMDPNINGYVTAPVSASAWSNGDNFKYVTSSITYDSWRDTFVVY